MATQIGTRARKSPSNFERLFHAIRRPSVQGISYMETEKRLPRQGSNHLLLQRNLSVTFSDDSGVEMEDFQMRVFPDSRSSEIQDFKGDGICKISPPLYGQKLPSTSLSYEQETSNNSSNVQLTKVSSLHNVFQISGSNQPDIVNQLNFECSNNRPEKPNLRCKQTLKTLTRKRFEAFRKKASVFQKEAKLKTRKSVRKKVKRMTLEPKDSCDIVEADSITTWTACQKRLHALVEHFAGETTAHGFKRTLRDTRSSTGKMIWLLAILCMLTVVIRQLASATAPEEMYAFSSKIHSLPHRSMAFPAVTVCSRTTYDNSKVAAMLDGLDLGKQIKMSVERKIASLSDGWGYEWIPSNEPYNHTDNGEDFNNLTTKDLEQSLGWKLEHFIERCYWNDDVFPCESHFIRAKTVEGNCFTFNSDPDHPMMVERVGSLSGLGLIINLGSQGQANDALSYTWVKVLIHDPKEHPNPIEQGLLVAHSTVTYIAFNKREYRFLPKPYKAYGTDYCSDSYPTGAESPYKLSSYSGCLADCRLREMVKECGCTVYGRDPDIHGIPYCSLNQLTDCYKPALQTFQDRPQNISSICACPLPCTKIEYQGQISTAHFRNVAEKGQRVHFKDLVDEAHSGGAHSRTTKGQYLELKIYPETLFTRVEEHVPTYSWSTVYATIGGQMGLFTGASVLTLFEFVELAILALAVIFRYSYSAVRIKVYHIV